MRAAWSPSLSVRAMMNTCRSCFSVILGLLLAERWMCPGVADCFDGSGVEEQPEARASTHPLLQERVHDADMWLRRFGCAVCEQADVLTRFEVNACNHGRYGNVDGV